MPTSRARGTLVLLGLLLAAVAPAAASFVTFESAQVRPLALSPDRSRLFAVNTPDDQLELYIRGADSNAPITQVAVTLDKITIRGGKTNWNYTLNEAAQGRLGVRLTLGTAVLWCADAPAKATGNPPSTAGTDKVGKFIARPKTPAPAVCPPTP